ncbi:LAS superfamily LD-carboxypeptidase LdcB [Pullulanibacillus pueri]|uniref:Putative carboxypeptidase YodJ n=1 Tax=Pullulanibacillus pueri TaxID=1437324 RepID=A0A8J2ZVN1_9BACL|nr:M15 family metallopeptidase [Pullulanibacillus pueri]MBM7682282.1 LAS superfamily LD-carboxypeptidase LdcB [Pullulanibacillus pueri]GGH80958.1 putative carboxypeptidase YodJ [Pullulanibacillus pueri]
MNKLKVTIMGLSCCALLVGCGTDKNSAASSATEKQSHKTEQSNQTTDSSKASDNQQNVSQKNNTSNSVDSEPEKKDKDGLYIVNDPQSILVLVNKEHKLPDGYVPPDLVYPDIRFPYSDMVEKRQVRSVTAEALKKLFKAADQAGYTLYGESGYRSYKRQVSVYDANVEANGEAQASVVSAHPGTSEHQTGLAIDITSKDMLQESDPLVEKFGDTPAGKWVAEHAHEYGFIIRYPKGKEDITGYEYEPWHIRYVGKEAATTIYDKGITLEEYLGKVNK